MLAGAAASGHFGKGCRAVGDNAFDDGVTHSGTMAEDHLKWLASTILKLILNIILHPTKVKGVAGRRFTFWRVQKGKTDQKRTPS